ncbi:MAG: YfhO family protein, partial [bacterium]|nr:YfhO family protein [bacterium]
QQDVPLTFSFPRQSLSRDQRYALVMSWEDATGKGPGLYLYGNLTADYDPTGTLETCPDRCRVLSAPDHPQDFDLVFSPRYDPPTHARHLHRQLLLPHMGAAADIETTRWAGALALSDQKAYLRELGENHEGYPTRYNPLPKQHRPLLDRYGIGYILTSHPFNEGPLDMEHIELIAETRVDDRRVALYRNLQAYPRVHLAARTFVAGGSGDALDYLKGKLPLASDTVTIQGDGLVLHEEQAYDTSGTATLRQYRPADVLINVQTADEAFLVLRDAYHHDWQATIDGTPARILQTDAVFRGIHVPPGTHAVRFAFDTAPLRVGLQLTNITGTALLFALFLDRRRNRTSL